MKKPLYFDYAAATPLSPAANAAMSPFYSDEFYNPSGLSLESRGVRLKLETARKQVAMHLGCHASEIRFVAGGTEGNNIAIQGVLGRYPRSSLIISAVEHDSVRQIAEHYTHDIISVDKYGQIQLDELEKTITDSVSLVSCVYVSNEIGTVQPLRKIAAIISSVREDRQKRGVRRPIYFHVDACQAARHHDIHVSRLNVDLMTINGGKLYGPKQSGILYVRSGVELTPLLHGGDQEFSQRSGTENVPSIMGFTAAFTETREHAFAEKVRLEKLRGSFVAALQKSFPDCVVHGHPKRVAPHVVSVAFPGVDNERLLMMLNERGIIVAIGSACRALKDTPSHVLSAIGVPRDISQSTIRMTFGVETTDKETTALLEKLEVLLPEAKKLS